MSLGHSAIQEWMVEDNTIVVVLMVSVLYWCLFLAMSFNQNAILHGCHHLATTIISHQTYQEDVYYDHRMETASRAGRYTVYG